MFSFESHAPLMFEYFVGNEIENVPWASEFWLEIFSEYQTEISGLGVPDFQPYQG